MAQQVGGRQGAGDNWLDRTGYDTPAWRQFVYDKWRQHEWLATLGLHHQAFDLVNSLLVLTVVVFRVFYLVLTRAFTVL